jgi:hypothetical protein
MGNTNLQKVNTYLSFFAISLFMIAGILLLIDWPLLAKAPLGICIGIESFYLLHCFYTKYWNDGSLSLYEFTSKLSKAFYKTDIG